MKALPPETKSDLRELLMRMGMGIVSLILLVALLAFAWVALIVGIVLFIGATIWVRWQASRANMPSGAWLSRYIHTKIWSRATAHAAKSGNREGGSPAASPFSPAQTIEAEYAVLDEDAPRSAYEDAEKTK